MKTPIGNSCMPAPVDGSESRADGRSDAPNPMEAEAAVRPKEPALGLATALGRDVRAATQAEVGLMRRGQSAAKERCIQRSGPATMTHLLGPFGIPNRFILDRPTFKSTSSKSILSLSPSLTANAVKDSITPIR